MTSTSIPVLSDRGGWGARTVHSTAELAELLAELNKELVAA